MPVSTSAPRASRLPLRSDISEALLHGAGPGAKQGAATHMEERWMALSRHPQRGHSPLPPGSLKGGTYSALWTRHLSPSRQPENRSFYPWSFPRGRDSLQMVQVTESESSSRIQNILLWLMSKSVLTMFSSRSFIVSGLTFKSLIHFDVVCIYNGLLLSHKKRMKWCHLRQHGCN